MGTGGGGGCTLWRGHKLVKAMVERVVEHQVPIVALAAECFVAVAPADIAWQARWLARGLVGGRIAVRIGLVAQGPEMPLHRSTWQAGNVEAGEATRRRPQPKEQ